MKLELTPLFQLNLLVHLTLPYPKSSNFHPYFYKQGYKINQIEKSIPLDPRNVKRFKETFESKKAVTPEMVLYHEKKKEYLLIECKVQKFDVDWSHHGTRQAAGYMSLSEDYLKDIFALERNAKIKAKIFYGIQKEEEAEMYTTLQCISETVKEIIGYAMPHETFGIQFKSDGLYLSLRQEEKIEEINVINKKALSNNAMIYIIPVDINGHLDTESKEVLQIQVRNVLRSILGKNIGLRDFSFTSTTICEKINPVWAQLPSTFKKKMKRWVHNYIKEIIEEIVSMGVRVDISEQNYSFNIVDERKAKNIRKFLLSKTFLEKQLHIFDDSEQITIEDFLV
ncbi:hypothetical protein H7U05_29705 [Priestia megaterium]|uniref:hypothetical protein n=1 Tax=Priestia megaterium TaxID=1404 RepID=UPI001C8F08B3|nr:hypothetical protein [Priestia megaterium]MBY0201399.1 hypothetical protein [Priestia megaterium]